MHTTYLTVAIPYVNADPHLGYAYELVLADIHARACRLDGRPTRFLGGTDDYSLKNVLAAEAAGRATAEFVAAKAARFAALAGPLDLSFDDFIHTSGDPRHVPAVHRLWNAALARGDLYKRDYEGDYCVGCERFYAPEELEGGRCPEHQERPERVAEENWFFRLSRYRAYLEELIASDRLRISPVPFKHEALAFVRSGLDDISVSRSTARARGWGVPVPGDPTQVVYVWFDALTNYLSALGYGDPGAEAHRTWWTHAEERTHVVGKGILRFHAVYWPAFLASAGEVPPHHLRVHPYLTLGRLKLSKSSGTTVDPVHVVSRFGTDALRWWFARDVGEVADTDFGVDRLAARCNEDLAGGVGNAVNRVVTLVHRLRDGVAPTGTVTPLDGLEGLPARVRGHLRRFELRRGTQEIVDAVGVLNQDLDRTQPWRIARDPARSDEVDELLRRHLDAAGSIAVALEPVTPSLSARARSQLRGAPRLPRPVPLVPRLDGPHG